MLQSVKHVRITTRCCDDLPVKNLEIRVGNSKVHKDNAMCNWVPGLLKERETRSVVVVAVVVVVVVGQRHVQLGAGAPQGGGNKVTSSSSSWTTP